MQTNHIYFQIKYNESNLQKCKHPETTKCIYFNLTTIAARNVSSISIHARKRDNIKGNPVTYPWSTKSREINTINLLQPHPPKLSIAQCHIQILQRMRYYIHTSFYLVKKQGKYEETKPNNNLLFSGKKCRQPNLKQTTNNSTQSINNKTKRYKKYKNTTQHKQTPVTHTHTLKIQKLHKYTL